MSWQLEKRCTHLNKDNVGAGFSQTQSHGLADASCAACDESGLAVEGEEAGHDECRVDAARDGGYNWRPRE